MSEKMRTKKWQDSNSERGWKSKWEKGKRAWGGQSQDRSERMHLYIINTMLLFRIEDFNNHVIDILNFEYRLWSYSYYS